MLGLSAYTWWKFLHVVGVIAFVTFHGVSVMAALRVRKERDRGRIATMLQLSGSSVTGMYVSLAWLITFGVVAGIQGHYWDDGGSGSRSGSWCSSSGRCRRSPARTTSA